MKLGRRISSRNYILFVKKSESPFHRLGIVVKKEIGPATFRNRMKRYIREFFRLHKSQIKGFYDIILMVKKGCSVNRYQEVEEELRGLLKLWKRKWFMNSWKKDSSFWFISISRCFQPSLGLAVVSLLPVPHMRCYRFNVSESLKELGSYPKDLSSAILSILVDTIQFPKLSKNIREET
jgi:ribonuclease P protein component